MLGVLAVAASTARVRDLPRTLSLAILSSFYVLAMGLWIFTQMPADKGIVSTSLPVPTGTRTEIGAGHLAIVIPDVLGGEHTAIGLLAVFTLACFLARTVSAFRLLAYVGVTLVTLLVNPWLTGFVGRYITGSITYERVFWLLPIPLAIGVCFSLGKQWLEARLTGRESTLLAFACLLGFYACTVDRFVISEANRAWIEFPPRLKVWPGARAVAEALCKLTPPGGTIVASEAISHQVVTIQGCGAPVIAGIRWMVAPKEEKWRRLNMRDYVTDAGDIPLPRVPKFREDLGRYRVVAVAMTSQALKNREVKAILRSKGFKKIRVVEKHHIWYRKPKR
jgi:hypothetical protein